MTSFQRRRNVTNFGAKLWCHTSPYFVEYGSVEYDIKKVCLLLQTFICQLSVFDSSMRLKYTSIRDDSGHKASLRPQRKLKYITSIFR